MPTLTIQPPEEDKITATIIQSPPLPHDAMSCGRGVLFTRHNFPPFFINYKWEGLAGGKFGGAKFGHSL